MARNQTKNVRKRRRSASTQYMYFNEIAEAIAPMLDEMFPPSSGVKITSITLVASVVCVRNNRTSDQVPVQAISDRAAADNIVSITRAEEDEKVQGQGSALVQEENPIIETLVEELAAAFRSFQLQSAGVGCNGMRSFVLALEQSMHNR
ncbi:hypothetical protein ACHAXH_000591 [Discostella pseudostelligera]